MRRVFLDPNPVGHFGQVILLDLNPFFFFVKAKKFYYYKKPTAAQDVTLNAVHSVVKSV